MRIPLKVVALLVFLSVGCGPMRGCVESTYMLSPYSRLPLWFAGAGLPRDQADVAMDYYVGPVDRTATFTLRDLSGRRVAIAVGVLGGEESLAPDPPEPDDEGGAIPGRTFQLVTVNGISEVIEHRDQPESFFYVNEDPEIKRRLMARSAVTH